MIKSLDMALSSSGIIRVEPQRYGALCVSTVSYEDKLILEFKRDTRVREKVYNLFIPRTILRGIFPEFSLATVKPTEKCAVLRSIYISANYIIDEDVYRAVLERKPETYLKYRTYNSQLKDTEQELDYE